jgi:hypothetical protein
VNPIFGDTSAWFAIVSRRDRDHTSFAVMARRGITTATTQAWIGSLISSYGTGRNDFANTASCPSSLRRHRIHIDHIFRASMVVEPPRTTSPYRASNCNSYEGPNLSGIDPTAGQIVTLFHPRRDRWEDHFQWLGPFLRGLTPVSRATITVLNINH